MEIPRHWRMRANRLRLEGYQRKVNGGIEISLTGSSWFELPNNFKEEKSVPVERIIYQAVDSELVSVR